MAVERVVRSRGRRQWRRREPFITAPPHAGRADLGRGPRDPRAQRRHDPRRGRRRDPRPPERREAVRRRRRRRRRHPGAVPARDVPPDRAGHGAVRVHPARPQSRQQRADRWGRDRVRAELRLAVRARPRGRAPVRHARRLPELREARVHVAAPPPLGRHGVRAGRRAREQAPPRHGVRPHPVQRQAIHGIGDRR